MARDTIMIKMWSRWGVGWVGGVKEEEGKGGDESRQQKEIKQPREEELRGEATGSLASVSLRCRPTRQH